MDTSVGCLINSISRFIHLVSCQMNKPMPIQQDYRSMVVVLKHIKPVLDEVADYKLVQDENLCEKCEELDMVVNDAREFMENWSSKMSKIFSVWHSGSLLIKIQSSSMAICRNRLLLSSPSTSSLTCVQQCMQEIKCMQQEMTSSLIEESLRSLQFDVVPCTDHLMKITEALDLTSNQELLKESIAMEKKRMAILKSKAQVDLNQIDQLVDLISHIRACLLKLECFEPKSGIPIPSYFRCPLSLELMLDPVIVASGQTYERASIQMWLDQGLTICPKTRRQLVHTNLIPNYTVKAMISNWCEENNVRLSSISRHTNLNSVLPSSDHDSLRSDSCRSLQSNSTPKSSIGMRRGFDKKHSALSSGMREVPNENQIKENVCCEHQCPELSCMHSRSESTSSAVSSVEYMAPASIGLSRISANFENASDYSGEIKHEYHAASPSNKHSGLSPSILEKQLYINSPKYRADMDSPKSKASLSTSGNHSYHRMDSLSFSKSASDDLTTMSHVKNLIEDLLSESVDLQSAAAAELRLLAKHNMENRVIIGNCGAIPPLLSLLYSKVELTQEHAVTALLNLSINEENKARIAEAGAIEPLIHVLNSGNDGAKENAAATLFSLSVLEEYKAKIGRSGAVKALVDLLSSGTLRGKKDAVTALFNLSIFHENKARIVQAGAVKYLVELLDPTTGMVDKAIALLANLSTIGDGRLAIVRAEGIPALVEVLDSGSQRGKENAASVLMQLCLNSPKFCNLVLQEGAVPPLVALSQSGTPRAKEKAQQLLSHFRDQREGSRGKGRQ